MPRDLVRYLSPRARSQFLARPRNLILHVEQIQRKAQQSPSDSVAGLSSGGRQASAAVPLAAAAAAAAASMTAVAAAGSMSAVTAVVETLEC